ncbi:MAG TPA: DUF427 domain-containing protein [Ktedonobacterales bacterium]|nr:DUF427 domain-containing protein [Ktedonobacterales bacterium]
MHRYVEDAFLENHPLTAPSPALRFLWEPSPRHVRVVFAGTTIADSKRAMLLLEAGHLPVYYFPWEDVRRDLFQRTEHTSTSDLKGVATYWTVQVGEGTAANAAWSYEAPPADGPAVAGYVAFYWAMMDEWYEEDERAVAHARDPYKLTDIRRSSRHVTVELGDVVVADSHRPLLLFETALPVRYYIPQADVRMDLLEPSTTHTQCAYKGEASYWSVRVGEQVFRDIAWCYREPLDLVTPIKDYACFYQERVDAMMVDGQAVERPQTSWSRQ